MSRLSIWVVAVLVCGGCSPKRAPLPHEVYLWQRVWTSAVGEAIEKSKGSVAGYVVLAGEIGWTQNRPTFAKAEVDYAGLREANVKVGLALRIGPYRGPFLKDDSAAKFIREQIATILQEAEAAGISPTELQIDFDCAQSKLGGYQIWLEMIQAAAGKTPVAITVLPSWLGEPAFRQLAKQAGGFILQVHSVQMPVAEGQKPKIFDANLARKWIQQADELGWPFRVALPTYTNQIITNAQGKIIRITSEDAPSLLPANAVSRFVRADAPEIARFLQMKAPAHLRGWLWYRLPLVTDRRNWRWETLQAVIDRQPLQAHLIAHLEGTDLNLENTGNVDSAFPVSVSAVWTMGRFAAADALPGWTWERRGNEVIFQPGAELREERLPPGGQVAVGWVRLEPPENLEVRIQNSSQTP